MDIPDRIDREVSIDALVIDGVLYVTGWGGDAWAIDARSGRQIWRHRRNLPADIRACCGPKNRGFGALGDRLFLGTADAHLLALDMRTGEVVWDAELINYKSGYSVTVAPLVVKDKVIVGVAGAEYGIRGFIDAYDVKPESGRGGSIPLPVRMNRAGRRGRKGPMRTCAAEDRSG